MDVKIISCCFVFVLLALAARPQSWHSRYVQPGSAGTLKYSEDKHGNRIPDFSRVGYHQGQRPIPAVPVVKTLEPAGPLSERRIQSAIDELAALPAGPDGFRGAILLRKGVYPIEGTIRINKGGIILRGEGEGTRLVATGTGQRSLILVSGSGQRKELTGSRRRITMPYVPVGATSLSLASADGLAVGDKIIVYRPGTDAWIEDLQMDQIAVRDSTTRQWEPQEYDLHFERVITGIRNNIITIDNPIVMTMEEQYGGGYIYRYEFTGRISEVGVEDLVCESAFSSSEDEDHGWNAVYFNNIEDGWVRKVTARHFGYSCVNLGGGTKQITVDSCRYLEPKSQVTGSRRYSFNNDGQLNLVMNCLAVEGRHDYVTGAKVCGPNVFYNCRSEKAKADIGPHHRWSTGTLYDNIVSDGEINVQDRGNWGTGHGWSGATQVIWNCTAAGATVQNPWVSGTNYIIGFCGEKRPGRLKERPDGYWEGLNNRGLQPRSLFRIQRAAANLILP